MVMRPNKLGRLLDRIFGGAPAVAAALFTTISANGWSAEYSGSVPTLDPDGAPLFQGFTRGGFTAIAGSPGSVSPFTYVENRIPTKRVRNPAPNDGVLTAATVALDDYVYSSDTPIGSGLANLSTVASPKPVAQWTLAPWQLVTGGSISPSIIADHRDGICAIVFSVTDGVTTITETVVNQSVANRTGDQYAVEEFIPNLDISGLNPGTLTVKALVYPFYGAAGSVLNSSDIAVGTVRSFTDLKLVKGTKYYVYVDPTLPGSDATGVVSTNAATASASPVATIEGALERARLTMPGGRVAGLEIRLRAGTYVGVTRAFNNYHDVNTAEVTLTRDPTVAQANVTFQYGAALTWQLKYLRVTGIQINRTAAVNFSGLLQLTLRDVKWIGVESTTTAIPITNFAHYIEGGFDASSLAGCNNLLAGNTLYMLRGSTWNDGSTGTYNVVGCKGNQCSLGANSQLESNGMIVSSLLRTPRAAGNNNGIDIGASGTVNGYLIRTVVVEWSRSDNASGHKISGDGETGSLTHMIMRNVVWAAQGTTGRLNTHYDEAAGTNRRTHSLTRMEGCVMGQLNQKTDRFICYNGNGTPNPAEAPNRIGGWPFMYGVGCRYNTICYIDAQGTFIGTPLPGSGQAAFSQEYGGIGTVYATSFAGRIDPKYVGFAGVTFNGSVYTAGAGLGNYALQADSPLKNRLPIRKGTRKFDAWANPIPASGFTNIGI